MAAPFCFERLLARRVPPRDHSLLPFRGYHLLVKVAKRAIVLRFKQRKAASQDASVGDGRAVYFRYKLKCSIVFECELLVRRHDFEPEAGGQHISDLFLFLRWEAHVHWENPALVGWKWIPFSTPEEESGQNQTVAALRAQGA